MSNITYPYNDDYMVYDYTKHRYILTEKYCLDVLGLNLREKVGGGRATNPQAQINNILDVRISQRLYSVIYSHNDKHTLEYILAKSPTARNVIRDAMGQELLYLLTEYEDKKPTLISEPTYTILTTPIPELRGNALIYRQRPAPSIFWMNDVPSYSEGHY